MKHQQTLLTTLSARILALGTTNSADAALVSRLPATPGGTDNQAFWLADVNSARTSGGIGDHRRGMWL